jgi:hypothetical protein
MNRRQRITVFIGMVVIALILIFPPMIGVYPEEERGVAYGHGFVLSTRRTYIAELDNLATNPTHLNTGWFAWRIDQHTLTCQIFIVGVLTGGFALLVGGHRD